jgi:LacI family transcriptional regulator
MAAEVLIADDDEVICYSLSRAVRGRGLTPLVAADGRVAVELFRRRGERVRAVFLDVVMPRLGGPAALGQISALRADVPCCLMTAYRPEDLPPGNVPLLKKPFDLDAFLAQLDRMLAPPTARTARARVALTFPPRYSLWADVVRGVMRFARDGPEWLVSVHHEEDVAVALAEKPDGVIGMVWSDDAAAKLRAWGGPVVDTGPNFPDGPFARVGLADAAVGQAAADHLLALGKRSMAVVTQPDIPATRLFADGFARRLAEAGLGCEYSPDVPTSPGPPTPPPPLADLVAWVSALPRPAAVFAVTDPLALRVCEACRAAGLRVPQDVAILGAMNDVAVCESGVPPLSSVRVTGEAVGVEAARVLEGMIAGQPPPPTRIEFPPEGVIVRASTDPTAVDDPVLALAIQFLRDHLADRIGVDDVVAAAGVSRSSLERRFRGALGHGPLAELLRLRAERVKQLLLDTDHSLARIALDCGFRDARHLAVNFRQKVGLTPTEFRTRYGPR